MIKNIQIIIGTAILSVIAGILLPGLFMHYNNTFSPQNVVDHMDSAAKRRYQSNLMEQQRFEDKRLQLLGRLTDTATIAPEQVNQLVLALDNVEKVKKASNKISISAFYPKNTTLALWPLLYFGFGCIIFLQGMQLPGRLKKRDFFLLFSLIFLFWRSTTWFRNTSLGKIDRIVYSVNNIDISVFGFFLQEALSSISLFMLTFIVCKWLAYADHLKNTFANSSDYGAVANNLRTVYRNWQVTSLFLTIGFGYYTYYFWSIISNTHDMRYLPQAIIIHFIWGLSWFSVSWPLIISAEIHSQFRENLIKNRKQFSYSDKAQEEIVEYTYKNDPISAQNQAITTLISGITFLLPLLKIFV